MNQITWFSTKIVVNPWLRLSTTEFLMHITKQVNNPHEKTLIEHTLLMLLWHKLVHKSIFQ